MGSVNILNSSIFIFMLMIYFLENKGAFGSGDDSSSESEIHSSKNKNSSDESEKSDIKNLNTSSSNSSKKLSRVFSNIMRKCKTTSPKNSNTSEPSEKLSMNNLQSSKPSKGERVFTCVKPLRSSKETGADTSKPTNKTSSKSKTSSKKSDDDSDDNGMGNLQISEPSQGHKFLPRKSLRSSKQTGADTSVPTNKPSSKSKTSSKKSDDDSDDNEGVMNTKFSGNSKTTGIMNTKTSNPPNKPNSKNKSSSGESDDDSGSSDEPEINKNLLKKFNNVGNKKTNNPEPLTKHKGTKNTETSKPPNKPSFTSKHSTEKSDNNSHHPGIGNANTSALPGIPSIRNANTSAPPRNPSMRNINTSAPLRNPSIENTSTSALPRKLRGPRTTDPTQKPRNVGAVKTDNPESSKNLSSMSKNSSEEVDSDSDNPMINKGPSKNYKTIGNDVTSTSALPRKPSIGNASISALPGNPGSKNKRLTEESDDDSENSGIGSSAGTGIPKRPALRNPQTSAISGRRGTRPPEHRKPLTKIEAVENPGTSHDSDDDDDDNDSSGIPKPPNMTGDPMTRDTLGKQKQIGIGSSGTSDTLNKPGAGNAAATQPNNMLIPSNPYPQGQSNYPYPGTQGYHGGYPSNYPSTNPYPQGQSNYPYPGTQGYYGGYPSNYPPSNAYPQELYNYPYPGPQDYYNSGYPTNYNNSYPIHHFLQQDYFDSSNVSTVNNSVVESLECYGWEKEPTYCEDSMVGRPLCQNLAKNIIPNTTLLYIPNHLHCSNAYVSLKPEYKPQQCKVLQCSYDGENYYVTTNSNETTVHILQFTSIINQNSDSHLYLLYLKSLNAANVLVKP